MKGFSLTRFLFLTGIVFFLKTFFPSPLLAQSCPPNNCLDINAFATSYSYLKDYFLLTARILNFSGTTFISEFDDNNGIYAGHLGSFWAPVGKEAVYSTHLKVGEDRSSFWRNGFAHGLLFYNRTTKECASEIRGSFNQGMWFPSKLVVSQEYQTPFKGKIIGIKTALPGYQGFALKLKIANSSSQILNLNLLSFSMLNSIATSSQIFYPPTDSNPENKRGYFQYHPEKQVITFSAPHIPNAHLAIGFDRATPLSSYRLADQGPNFIDDDFCDNGILNQVGNDSPEQPGSELGLASELPPLSPQESLQITIYFVFGSTPQSAIGNLETLRNQDVEQLADNFWNQRLEQLSSSVPLLEINNESLKKIYFNSFLNILLNHFENGQGKSFYGLGDITYLGQFPWQAINNSLVWTWTDPQGFKETLENFLQVDLTKCKAYNPITGANYCSSYYAFDPSTIIIAAYDYLTITQDWDFLSQNVFGRAGGQEKTQSVLQWLKEIAYLKEPSPPSNSLVDFGHDNNLYEFRGENCQLKGLYTGKVPTPNGERYALHKKLEEIYRKIDNHFEANKEREMANFAKAALNQLWNDQEGWLDTISLYDETMKPRTTPFRNTFKGVGIFHLLDYSQLLNNYQKEKLLSHLNEFEAPVGLYSVSKNERQKWCQRADWHGPGIYIGELGRLIGILFQNGKSESAYRILTSLSFMANSPYFGQCVNGDSPGFARPVPDGCGSSAYLEGASIAQAFIKGLFGIQPKTRGLQIAPHIPQELANEEILTLKNIRFGANIYSVEIHPNLSLASIIQTEPSHFKISLSSGQKIMVIGGEICQNNDFLCPAGCSPKNDRDCTKTLLRDWGKFPFNSEMDLNFDNRVNALDFGEIFNPED